MNDFKKDADCFVILSVLLTTSVASCSSSLFVKLLICTNDILSLSFYDILNVSTRCISHLQQIALFYRASRYASSFSLILSATTILDMALTDTLHPNLLGSQSAFICEVL